MLRIFQTTAARTPKSLKNNQTDEPGWCSMLHVLPCLVAFGWLIVEIGKIQACKFLRPMVTYILAKGAAWQILLPKLEARSKQKKDAYKKYKKDQVCLSEDDPSTRPCNRINQIKMEIMA